jgi:magnesium-transporting ATPase (P-type)
LLFGNFETRAKGSFDKQDDLCPFVYKSSVVLEGSGLAIVTAVGNRTQERRDSNFKKAHNISDHDLSNFE